ncbi:MAG TPA: hypothetical protein VFF67_00845 [Thermoplasmata archaeon]|nr:hypothetical protein [Thermoplasmata archaeon]
MTKAPYKGSVIQQYNQNNQIGCSKAKNVIPAKWSATTGIGGFSILAHSPKCTTLFGNTAYAQGEFNLFVPFHYKGKTASHYIIAQWVYNYSGTENLTSGTCVGTATATSWSCYQNAYTYLTAYAYLYDVGPSYTTYSYPTVVWAGIYNSTSNSTSCSTSSGCSSSGGGGAAAVSGSVTYAWNITATLNATHRYYIQTYLAGYVSTSLTSYNGYIKGGNALAQLNVATLGNGAKLLLIEVL